MVSLLVAHTIDPVAMLQSVKINGVSAWHAGATITTREADYLLSVPEHYAGAVQFRIDNPDAPPPPPSVPDRVTAASVLLVLGQMGKLAQVQGVIAGLPEAAPARILWDRATDFRRSNPLWEAFATTIGLTAADVDAAFIAAGQLDQELGQ